MVWAFGVVVLGASFVVMVGVTRAFLFKQSGWLLFVLRVQHMRPIRAIRRDCSVVRVLLQRLFTCLVTRRRFRHPIRHQRIATVRMQYHWDGIAWAKCFLARFVALFFDRVRAAGVHHHGFPGIGIFFRPRQFGKASTRGGAAVADYAFVVFGWLVTFFLLHHRHVFVSARPFVG